MLIEFVFTTKITMHTKGWILKTPTFVSFVVIAYFLSGLRLLHVVPGRFLNSPAETL